MPATEPDPDDFPDMGIALMTLRKPTDLKKVIDSIPKPVKAVPKNGLPLWYKIGLESKLPVPVIPKGKIIFSRGKIGENVRRSDRGFTPSFDISDPYCNHVSFDYDPLHDPHLAHHFAQKQARARMVELGFITKDGRAVCSLKQFNQYRKFLYNIFMDRIHAEMQKIDERARDDITLHRVALDVSRRLQAFQKAERARAQLAKAAAEFGSVLEEKKRMAEERERKDRERICHLAEYNERQRRERAARAQEKEMRIKQRVQAAAELELRRKIMMVRTWRVNERKRLNRVQQVRDERARNKESEENRKWAERIEAQNAKIQEENFLLKIYTDDMKAGAKRRKKAAAITAYDADLQLQRIRMANLKIIHGEAAKTKRLVKKLGKQLEKAGKGEEPMDEEMAYNMADQAMSRAMSVASDRYTTLGQARCMMDVHANKPSPPLILLDEILEASVVESGRRRMNNLLRYIATSIRTHAGNKHIYNRVPPLKKKMPRWSQFLQELAVEPTIAEQHSSINFGEVTAYPPKDYIDADLRSVRGRRPTPVPSKTKLVEVTFTERLPDLPDPVNLPSFPERQKLIEVINIAGKLLSRSVTKRVDNGVDPVTGKITMPIIRHPMEWGEAVECMTTALMENRINADCPELRRASEFLAYRILLSMINEKKELRARARLRSSSSEREEPQAFYVPDQVK